MRPILPVLRTELHFSLSDEVINEAAGRSKACELGLVVVGTVGIFLRAKQAQLIPEIQPLLIRLRSGLNFFLSDSFVDSILTHAGESPDKSNG